MLDPTIPGFGRHELIDVACDQNGTLAADGTLIDGSLPMRKEYLWGRSPSRATSSVRWQRRYELDHDRGDR